MREDEELYSLIIPLLLLLLLLSDEELTIVSYVRTLELRQITAKTSDLVTSG